MAAVGSGRSTTAPALPCGCKLCRDLEGPSCPCFLHQGEVLTARLGPAAPGTEERDDSLQPKQRLLEAKANPAPVVTGVKGVKEQPPPCAQATQHPGHQAWALAITFPAISKSCVSWKHLKQIPSLI